MKLTLVIAYEIEGSEDDAHDVVSAVMAAVYNARTPSTPEAWTLELSKGESNG